MMMRTGHVLAALVAVAGALPGCSSGPDAPPQVERDVASTTQPVTFSPSGDRAYIRAVHWNIAGGVVAFTDDFPFLNPDRPHNMGRAAPVLRLIQFIEEWQPDVISVNEITAVQYVDLLATLRLRGFSVNGHFVRTGFNVGPAGMAILTTAPASERATYYWNGTAFEQDGEQSSRAVACLTADLGEPVRVCTTHLETTDSIAATQVQSLIRDWSADLAARPHLLLGDLNAEPNWLGSILYPPGAGNGCFGAGGPFVEADMNASECGEATHGEGKLDYVLGTAAHFTDRGYAEIRDGGDCILTLAGRHPCSDHRAVLAEMELRLFDHGIGEATPSYAGPDVSGNAGSAINLYGRAPASASVLWSYTVAAGTDPGGSCVFADPGAARTTISCDRPGTYVATLTADGVASDSALVRISNIAPEVSITGPDPWQLFTARSNVRLQASIADSAGDSHTCRVDWDDGTTEEYPASAAGCARDHVYRSAGMYTIQLSVVDSAGASGVDEVLVVVHDPAGGWANLDGSLFSPAGALVDSTVGAGEVWAHLTGRYYDLTPVPVGAARAWLPGTQFRFEPATLDWMVVTPEGRVAARATGSFAGQPGYGLLLYGQDGCNTATPSSPCQPGEDQGRFIVWPLSAGPYPAGTITYDSSQGGDNLDLDRVRLAPFQTGGVTLQFPLH